MANRRVACGILIRNDAGHVLLILKKSDTWEFPGGKQDGDETIKECARRELSEETGISPPGGFEFVNFCDLGKKFLVMLLEAPARLNYEAKLVEPHKHKAIGWFAPDDLPKNLSDYTKCLIDKGVLDDN